MNKEQIKRIIREYIEEIPGVSQRDSEDKAERIANRIMFFARNQTLAYLYESRSTDLVSCKKLTFTCKLPTYNEDPDASGPLVALVPFNF